MHHANVSHANQPHCPSAPFVHAGVAQSLLSSLASTAVPPPSSASLEALLPLLLHPQHSLNAVGSSAQVACSLAALSCVLPPHASEELLRSSAGALQQTGAEAQHTARTAHAAHTAHSQQFMEHTAHTTQHTAQFSGHSEHSVQQPQSSPGAWPSVPPSHGPHGPHEPPLSQLLLLLSALGLGLGGVDPGPQWLRTWAAAVQRALPGGGAEEVLHTVQLLALLPSHAVRTLHAQVCVGAVNICNLPL